MSTPLTRLNSKCITAPNPARKNRHDKRAAPLREWPVLIQAGSTEFAEKLGDYGRDPRIAPMDNRFRRNRLRRRFSVILGMGLLLPFDLVMAQASSTVDFKGEWRLVSGDTSAPCSALYFVGGIKWHKTLVGDESFRGFLWLKTRSGKPRNTRCPAVETPRAHYLEVTLFAMGNAVKPADFVSISNLF